MIETEKLLTLTKPQSDGQIMAFYTEAMSLRQYAEARTIATNDDLKPATDDLVIIARVKKGMEEKRKEYLNPFQAHIKETNEAYKTLMEPIEQADKITRDKILAFRAEQERKRQEAERINAERIKLAEDEMKLKGELTESVNLIEVGPPTPAKTQTDMGTAGARDNWKWALVSFAELPDEYKMPDATKIGKVVRAGLRTIPGVIIWNDPIIVVITK